MEGKRFKLIKCNQYGHSPQRQRLNNQDLIFSERRLRQFVARYINSDLSLSETELGGEETTWQQPAAALSMNSNENIFL